MQEVLDLLLRTILMSSLFSVIFSANVLLMMTSLLISVFTSVRDYISCERLTPLILSEQTTSSFQLIFTQLYTPLSDSFLEVSSESYAGSYLT